MLFVIGTALLGTMVAATLAIAMIATALTFSMIATTLTITMSGTTTATALLHTTACGQFGTCGCISLHIVGIVAQLADLLTQLVGVGLLRIVVDGQLGRLLVVGVGFHALEIRHVLFEFVGTFLADAVGLDRHGLLVLGGRFLGAHTQRDEAY